MGGGGPAWCCRVSEEGKCAELTEVSAKPMPSAVPVAGTWANGTRRLSMTKAHTAERKHTQALHCRRCWGRLPGPTRAEGVAQAEGHRVQNADTGAPSGRSPSSGQDSLPSVSCGSGSGGLYALRPLTPPLMPTSLPAFLKEALATAPEQDRDAHQHSPDSSPNVLPITRPGKSRHLHCP